MLHLLPFCCSCLSLLPPLQNCRPLHITPLPTHLPYSCPPMLSPSPLSPSFPEAYFQIANWLLVHRILVCQWCKPLQTLPHSLFLSAAPPPHTHIFCHLWFYLPCSVHLLSLTITFLLSSTSVLSLVFRSCLFSVLTSLMSHFFLLFSVGSIDASPRGSAVVHLAAVGIVFPARSLSVSLSVSESRFVLSLAGKRLSVALTRSKLI